MIYPYKWEISAHWHLCYLAWIVMGRFQIKGTRFTICFFQDDKKSMRNIDASVFKFWRLRGAM